MSREPYARVGTPAPVDVRSPEAVLYELRRFQERLNEHIEDDKSVARKAERTEKLAVQIRAILAVGVLVGAGLIGWGVWSVQQLAESAAERAAERALNRYRGYP